MEELDKYDPKIREYLNEVGFKKWTTVHSASNRYSTMTSNIAESLNATNIAARELPISTMLEFLRSLLTIYTLSKKTKTPFSVDLEKGTCCCRRFQTDKIPCAHAISVIRKYKNDPLLYCSKYYMKKTYINTYGSTVYPMTNKSTWNTPQEVNDVIVLPPESRTKSGRPKKKRILAGHKKWSKNKCTVCKKMGHNKKTCRG
ncbi:uncharacterized protein LOC126668543 [Mercurialis annua]|uniref:uncharacterized protein LOC126668543 n=1 Tax=Mercurialis annua TaxID=3986 RepID=UPI00216078D7|nr:uncharacterized protein LOC126668543 [Mercurialis annua]